MGIPSLVTRCNQINHSCQGEQLSASWNHKPWFPTANFVVQGECHAHNNSSICMSTHTSFLAYGVSTMPPLGAMELQMLLNQRQPRKRPASQLDQRKPRKRSALEIVDILDSEPGDEDDRPQLPKPQSCSKRLWMFKTFSGYAQTFLGYVQKHIESHPLRPQYPMPQTTEELSSGPEMFYCHHVDVSKCRNYMIVFIFPARNK